MTFAAGDEHQQRREPCGEGHTGSLSERTRGGGRARAGSRALLPSFGGEKRTDVRPTQALAPIRRARRHGVAPPRLLVQRAPPESEAEHRAGRSASFPRDRVLACGRGPLLRRRRQLHDERPIVARLAGSGLPQRLPEGVPREARPEPRLDSSHRQGTPRDWRLRSQRGADPVCGDADGARRNRAPCVGVASRPAPISGGYTSDILDEDIAEAIAVMYEQIAKELFPETPGVSHCVPGQSSGCAGPEGSGVPGVRERRQPLRTVCVRGLKAGRVANTTQRSERVPTCGCGERRVSGPVLDVGLAVPCQWDARPGGGGLLPRDLHAGASERRRRARRRSSI